MEALLLMASMSAPEANGVAKVEGAREVGYFEKAVKDVVCITVKIPKAVVAGEKVPLWVRLKNQTKESVTFSKEFWKLNEELIITIRNKQGEVPQSQYGKRLWNRELGRDITVTLAPGREVQLRYNLARLFDLSLAGNYILQIQFVCSVNSKVRRINLDLPFRIEEGE